MMNRLKEPGLNFNSDTAIQYRLYAIEISMNLFDAVKSIQHYTLSSNLFCGTDVRPIFSWSIFIRAVIDHMICYNLNWPKIKL